MRLALPVLLTIVLAGSASPQPPPQSLHVPAIPFEKYKLPNGLEIILHEDHRLPLVAIDVWYHVGPLNEAQGRTGFAHLFEHMMFEGSEHVGEKAHFKFLEGAGATDINGTTDFDRTNYFETLPSNQLELGLWLESDRMGFLLEKLDRTRLTNQRDVVRNERRQGEGFPYELAEEEMYHLLFPKNHPYYADVIGSHADIEAARLLDVRDFHQRFYIPNNATIAIAGDFDRDALKPLLVRYFSPIPAGPVPPKVQAKAPPITEERRSVVTDDVKLPRVTVAWLTPPAFTPGDSEADLFMRILGSGSSSRLYQKLVYEKQSAQEVSCETNSLALQSASFCNITARPGVKPEDLEAEINRQIDELRTNGPSQAELDRARTRILTTKIVALQRLGGFGGVADTLNEYNQYVGDPGFLPKDLARYQNATVQSLKTFAQQSFAKNHRVTIYTVSGKKVLNDVPRSPDSTDADVKVVNPFSEAFEAEQNWRNSPPAAGPTPRLHLPVPASFTLGNGLKVYIAEDHALPVVSASVLVFAGADANPANRPGLAAYTARMLRQGTARRSATQIANEAGDIGATLSTTANDDGASASIGGLSTNVEPALDLLSDVIQHPSFKQEEVERIRGEQLASIVQESDNPIQTVLRVGRRIVYGDTAYAFPGAGTTECVKAINSDDVMHFWLAHYAPQNASLVLAGDITPERGKELAEHYIAAWSNPNASPPPNIPTPPANPKQRIVLVDKPGAPQTALIVFGVGIARRSSDYAATDVMNAILGGLFSSRINMNLRERNGYTYGAFSFFDALRGAGPLLAGGLVRTDVTAPAAQELFKELHAITTEPPTTTEIQLAKNFALQSLSGHFETARTTSLLIGDLFIYDLPLDYYRALPAQYDSLTAPEITAAAEKHVRPDDMVLVAVGDRAKIQPGLEKLGLGPIELRDQQGNLITK
jgi:zinc protease